MKLPYAFTWKLSVASVMFLWPDLAWGTVTFLFTDIEGSTLVLKQLGSHYGEVLQQHQRILRSAFAAHGGRVVDTQDDSIFVAFRRANDAVAAAVDAQRDVAAHDWPEGAEVKVRMGLQTGEPKEGGERYVGMGVHKAARIGAAGHGGQVLLSRTTSQLVEDELPPGVTIRDLGERRLKDLDRPERLSQLVIDGLPSQFGPLKTLDVELTRKRRRMYATSALIGVLAAAVAIPVFALGQGSGRSAKTRANTLAIINLESTVVAAVPVGIRPAPVAVGAGSVWVGNLGDRTISRIDPVARAVVRTIPLGTTPTGLAAAPGAVWVANGLLGTVTRLDPAPAVDMVVKTIHVALRSNAGSVALRERAVWTAFGSGEVAKIDARTSRVLSTGIVGDSPSAVAVGEGAVWVANAGDNNGAPNNPGATSACTSEHLVVGKNQPTVSTAQNLLPNDLFTLSGATLNATGTITFNLFAPSDATCAGPPAYTEIVIVSGNGTYTTHNNTFFASTEGTWRWQSSYTGDANNNLASSACGVERFTIANS